MSVMMRMRLFVLTLMVLRGLLAFTVPGAERGRVKGLPSLARSPQVQEKIYASLEEAVAGSSGPQLLIFFSLSCHVCWEDLFEMKEFIEKYHIPVGIIGIGRESITELESFAARYSFPYPIVHDRTKQLYRRFRVKLEPYRVILDQGRVLYQDDLTVDFFERRDRAKQCLLEIASR